MADTKISAATPFTGTGAASRGAARAGSTTAYRTVDNLNATVDPTATDDSTLFYHVGSMWLRPATGEMWVCTDATASAAVWLPRSGQYSSPRNRFYAYTDCVSTNPDDSHWIAQVGGAGAAIDGVAIGTLNAFGINTLTMGTTTTGRASITGFSAGQPHTLLLGLGRCRMQAKAAINILSNGTETFTTRIGLIDSVSAEPTDGCYFRYTHSVNTGKWEAVTRSNGTETATDTGITVVADAWKRFEVDVNAAGTSVVFKIDGSTVATNTTNIPTGAGRYASYGVSAIKSAGTTSMSGLYIDFMEVDYQFTTAR